jgi:hypoxanthine phosphoribosyltransferase
MAQLKDSMIPAITRAEINEMIIGLAQEIENDYEGQEIIIICPLKGSVLFVADLVRKLELPSQIDFVYVTSTKTGGIKILKDISVNITGKHVLIVEEIIDNGRTLNFLKNRLAVSNPASLRIVTLIDKPARRELQIHPDYVGKTIDDRFVLGYGMDIDEIGRNYSDIYYFKQ